MYKKLHIYIRTIICHEQRKINKNEKINEIQYQQTYNKIFWLQNKRISSFKQPTALKGKNNVFFKCIKLNLLFFKISFDLNKLALHI